MRISDWSSDVCSSDLHRPRHAIAARRPQSARLSTRPVRLPLPAARRAAICRRCDARSPPHPSRAEARYAAGNLLAAVLRGQEPPLLDAPGDRKSVVEGKSVSVSVDFGGRRNLKKKTLINNKYQLINTSNSILTPK